MGQAAEERMTEEIATTRESLTRDVDALYDKVSPGRVVERRKAAARDRVSSLKDRVMGTARSAQDSAQGAAGSVTGSASDAVSNVGGTAQQAAGAVHRQTVGSPLAAGLVAFGAGMVISALIPASEKESQAAQRLVDTAKEHGQPVVDEAKAVGQDVGQSLKDKATEAAEDLEVVGAGVGEERRPGRPVRRRHRQGRGPARQLIACRLT
ncbi:DUF3618 domain-containing protein [Nocardioides sp. TF02-7]|uniref:DUF3618 domain-containing protein n=1 Tax=Nocardioides sp. TF02-7 TaxID=2917724 RepID=UPI001F05E84A|nr:DUF3618 domain-containing protein [Nocardioides sp. TF02-7]UMG92434.1 DUF3618 domain-containing protein [Nocardioides sp. TF02-7]